MLRLTKALSLLLLITVVSFNSLGQNGSIAGNIFDDANNEPLIGAAIQILNTDNLGSATDLDGHYMIEGLAPGNYTIKVSYVSYQTKEIQDVTVKEGEVTPLDITMTSTSNELDMVVITTSYRQETIQAVLSIQKNNISISDGISKDIIQRSPDRNTGEVLKRLSGTTIVNGRFAVIRGLGDRYNIALINRNILPSTEPDRKSFSFDLFPSNMLDNLFIYKTAQPDLPGDFAGGIIQLNTKDIPDENFLSISIGTGINTQTTFQSYAEYKGGKTDWLGLDDGTRAIPEGFPDPETYEGSSTDEKVVFSKLMQNNWGAETFDASPLDQSYQINGGSKLTLGGKDVGLVGAVTYSSNRSTTFVERNDFLLDGTPLFTYKDSLYRHNVMWGLLLNGSIKLNDNNRLTLRNSFSVNSNDNTSIRGGRNNSIGTTVANEYFEFVSNSLTSTTLVGDHVIRNSKIKLNWSAGINNITRNQPDLRTSFYYKADGDSTYYTFVTVNNATPEGNFKFYSYLQETAYNASLDVTMPFYFGANPQQFKVGMLSLTRDRSFDARLMGYVINNQFYQVQDAFSYLALPRNEIFSNENIADSLFYLKDVTTKSDSYTARVNNNAFYAMFDNKVSNMLRIVWGARAEFFNQALESFERSASTNPEEIVVDSKELDSIGLPFDLLPSVNIIFSITDETNIRLSGSKTVVRPEIRELAPFGYYDYENSAYILGNSSLLSTDIFNGDLRIEKFMGRGQVVSISGFYKYFRNPIQLRRFSTGIFTQIDPINEEKATNIGAEFELRKNLSFIKPGVAFLENITFNTNLAYIKSVIEVQDTAYFGVSERPLQGQSPYVINAGLTYLQPSSGASFTVLYNVIGRRIMELGYANYPDIYQNPRPLLDIQGSIPFAQNKANLKITLADVLASDDIFYQDIDGSGDFDETQDQVINRYLIGSRISASLSYRF